jgi:hypothetical protein
MESEAPSTKRNNMSKIYGGKVDRREKQKVAAGNKRQQ